MCIYYVYAYLRNKDSKTAKAGTPYYIGKGKDKRAFRDHGKTPVPLNKDLIVFIECNLSEIGALALERRYIKWYGRKDLSTGILLNKTDGGEGAAGMIRTVPQPHSVATRLKIANYRTGKSVTTETKAKISATIKENPRKPRGPYKKTREKYSQNLVVHVGNDPTELLSADFTGRTVSLTV